MKKLFAVLFLSTALFAADISLTTNPLILTVNEGESVKEDLRVYVVTKAPVGELKFSSPKLPPFLTLTAKGLLKGDAEKAGDYKFSLTVLTSGGGLVGHPVVLQVRARKAAGPLECKDKSQAFYVGSTDDKKYDLFTCPR